MTLFRILQKTKYVDIGHLAILGKGYNEEMVHKSLLDTVDLSSIQSWY